MSDNLKVAKECGAVLHDSRMANADGDMRQVVAITFKSEEQLQEYTSRILASQQAAHAAEIASLKAELTASDAALRESRANDMESMRQLSAANALIAMQAEALDKIQAMPAPCEPKGVDIPIFTQWADTTILARDALSASAETVAAWEAEKLEPLQAQVNMMRQLLIKCDMAMDRPINERVRLHSELLPAIEETQATAEQFIAEREQCGAVKALDKVIKFGASEREARLVFANLQDRDNFLALVVGATSKKAG